LVGKENAARQLMAVFALVELELHRAGHGGLAVLDQQDTLTAVNIARVQKLVLQKDFHRDGWCCMHCHYLGASPTPFPCPFCGGQTTATELGEGMVQAVLQTDGEVEVIVPDERLAAYDGVGALLRYRISEAEGGSALWSCSAG
jgi:peptide subunit release factor 1 (eRF1)